MIMWTKKIINLTQKILRWLKSPIQLRVQSFARRYYELTNYFFTKKYSLDFNGYIPGADLIVDSKISQANATAYQAYGGYYFKSLIGFAISIDGKPGCFVDIGCGKEKQCIYAEKYFGFNRIIGIDFSKALIGIANQNLFNVKYFNIEFTVADAVNFKLPEEYCMVFLYNPFSEIILEKFILNNLNNFKKHGSTLCYANDIHRKVLIKFGFETIYRDHEHNSIHRLS